MTKQDLQDAFTAVMWAYYWKKEKAQYDSLLFTSLDYPDGGAFRNTTLAAPEDGTKDSCIYAVCSSYPYMAYYNTFLVDGKPFCWMHGEKPYATDYLTYTMWESGLAGTTVLRWAQRLEDEDLPRCRANGWERQESYTRFRGMDNAALAAWFRDNWRRVLEPGDLLVPFVPRGHVATYMGAGMVLEAKGKKWADGQEAYEPDGCFDLYDIEDYFINGSAFASSGQRYRLDRVKQRGTDGSPVYALERFLIMRPLNLLLDESGNVRPGVGISPAARCRMQYPGLEIDRTVDITPFGTAETGGELRLCVTLTNHSNDPYQGIYEDRGQTPVSFPKWRTSCARMPGYDGLTYRSLPVTEQIPAGAAYVPGSASPGAEISGQTLAWRVTLAPGERRSMQYALRVTAPRGGRIECGGGFVGQIPSNCPVIAVGGKKLPPARTEALPGLPAGPELHFAESVLRAAFGLRLELPEAQELFDAFFTPATLQNSHPDAAAAGLFVPRAQASAQCADAAAMRVHRYLGGRMIHTPHLAHERIYEFRTEYLEPGDILVKGMLKDGRVLQAAAPVYLGGGQFACRKDGRVQCSADERIMWDSYGYDFFFALRPSQAWDDAGRELAD